MLFFFLTYFLINKAKDCRKIEVENVNIKTEYLILLPMLEIQNQFNLLYR